MKKHLLVLLSGLCLLAPTFTSCVSSSPSLCVAPNTNLRQYRYLVLSDKNECSRMHDGTLIQIQKELSSSYLEVVSQEEGEALLRAGYPVLISNVLIQDPIANKYVKTAPGNTLETVEFESTATVINIYFRDLASKKNVAIIKCKPNLKLLRRQLSQDLKTAFR